MDRPTALLRRLLIAEAIQAQVTQEIGRIQARMRDQGLKILDRQDNVHDIWIQYQCGRLFDEAIFMRKMLDAESTYRAKRTGIFS